MSSHSAGADRVRKTVDGGEELKREAPRPLIRELPPADPFPIDALGDVLAPAARAIQDRVQAPVAMCAQSVLAAATLATQGHADIQLPTGQIKPLSSYYISIGVTGERKSAESLVAQHMETLKDGKKMAKLGFEEGIEFIPFADISFSAAKAIQKDNASPVRATAASALVNDMDPRITQALVRTVSDKSWIVRASAVLAIAKREDPDLLNAIVPALSDKNKVVRFTAAAAVIRLTAVAARNKDVTGTSNMLGGESRSRQTPTATSPNPL